MDELAEMFKQQSAFQRNFFQPEGADDEARTDYTKEMVLNIIEELDELLKATGNWKEHRYEPSQPRKSGIQEECVDVFKYLVNIMLAYGITPSSFMKAFDSKSLVVEERYAWEKTLSSLKLKDKVAAVDLDGVLAAYPENWLAYLSKLLGTAYTLDDFSFIEAPLPSIPRNVYMRLKHEYRESGHETLYVDVVSGAASFTNALRLRGYKVIILSARPYKKYKRMLADTILWLRKHRIHYDAVLWDQHKHVRIIEQFPQLSFMVEDNPRIASQVASLGYRCYLLNRPYNQGVSHPNISRVSKLDEIVKEVET